MILGDLSRKRVAQFYGISIGYFYLKHPSRVEDALGLSIENGFADTWFIWCLACHSSSQASIILGSDGTFYWA